MVNKKVILEILNEYVNCLRLESRWMPKSRLHVADVIRSDARHALSSPNHAHRRHASRRSGTNRLRYRSTAGYA